MEISIFFSTLVLSCLMHYGIQRIFIYYKKFDDFNHRSSHNTLATRTGGIGIFATLFIISLYYYFLGVEIFDYSLFIPLGVMFVVGVYDDFYNADFKLKFFLQIIVAKILIDNGYVISNYYGLFGINEIPWLLAQLSTVFVFLVIVNAINFIDGIDGLAITETIKIILIIQFFSYPSFSQSNFIYLVILSILPLYYFNFKKKRKIFLGDAGSLLLGTIVAVCIFIALGDDYSFNPELQLNKVIFSLMVLAYPLIDLLRVFILRIKKGVSPFVADSNHLHHKIINLVKRNHFYSLVIIQICSISLFLILYTIATVSDT